MTLTDMDSKMEVAIVAFVGVIVGAVISVVGQFALAFWSARRDDKAKRLLVKLAARLVEDELSSAYAAILGSHTSGRWYHSPDLCKTLNWREYRSTLAGVLPYAQWRSLCDGILAVEIIGDVRSHTFDELNPSLTPETRDVIVTLGPKVETAVIAIQPYASDVPRG